MLVIVEEFPKMKNGNFVVDVHNGFERLFYCVVPHQMVCHKKTFWGYELTQMKYGPHKPDGSFNLPVQEKIFEYISDTFQTVDEINNQLRADGYNLHFNIDIKSHIYRLRADGKIITQYNNKVMMVKRNEG